MKAAFVMADVVADIVAAIEAGAGSWSMPWRTPGRYRHPDERGHRQPVHNWRHVGIRVGRKRALGVGGWSARALIAGNAVVARVGRSVCPGRVLLSADGVGVDGLIGGDDGESSNDDAAHGGNAE